MYQIPGDGFGLPIGVRLTGRNPGIQANWVKERFKKLTDVHTRWPETGHSFL